MNILFFYHSTISPYLGGIQRITYNLGEYFKSKHFNVYYLSLIKKSNYELQEQFYLPNSSNITCPINKQYYNFFLKEKKIDIVINQAGILPHFSSFLVNAHPINIPLITAIHNNLTATYGISNHLQITPNILRPIVNKLLLYFFKWKYGKSYRDIIKRSNQTIILSDKFYKEIHFFSSIPYDILKKKITIIPNLIWNSPQTSYNKKKKILFVGRLSKEKRVLLLLKIWKSISISHPDWALIIVGDGKEKNKLCQFIQKEKISNVSMKGYCNPDKYYDEASIFCMTSAFESFGLVLVEAMNHQVLPIAFDTYPTLHDIIDNGINGLIIKEGNIKQYINEINHLIENPEIIQKLSKAAYIKSRQFSIDLIGDKWLKIIVQNIKDNTKRILT